MNETSIPISCCRGIVLQKANVVVRYECWFNAIESSLLEVVSSETYLYYPCTNYPIKGPTC